MKMNSVQSQVASQLMLTAMLTTQATATKTIQTILIVFQMASASLIIIHLSTMLQSTGLVTMALARLAIHMTLTSKQVFNPNNQ